MDDSEKEVKELVERFRKSLQENQAESYFDEDDLIEIFDYAGDHGDDYVRMEVLLRAARYFPDSEELWERRAVFYGDVLPESVEQFTSDNYGRQTLLTTLISLRATNAPASRVTKVIREILGSYDHLSDEEVIQLVDLASDNHITDLLLDNIEEFKSKTDYLPTLLYELGAELIDTGRYGDAVEIVEQLVGEMPFNVEYWNLMAEAYTGEGRLDDAREAVDTALAIEPANQTALQYKGRILLESGAAIKEILELRDAYPDDEHLNEYAVKARVRDNDIQSLTAPKELEQLKALFRKYPQNSTFLNALLQFAPTQSDDILDEYWDYCSTLKSLAVEFSEWLSWAQSFEECDNREAAIRILKCFRRKSPPYKDIKGEIALHLGELHFRLGDYARAAKEIGDYYNTVKGFMDMENNPVAAFIECYSLAALGDTEEARKQANLRLLEMASEFPNHIAMPTEKILLKTGIMTMLDELSHALADNRGPFPRPDFDPHTLWPIKIWG